MTKNRLITTGLTMIKNKQTHKNGIDKWPSFQDLKTTEVDS